MIQGYLDRRAAIIVLALLWLLVQAGSFHHYGIRHGNDTAVYTEAARAILDGRPAPPRVAAYPGFILWIAFFLGTGLGETALVLAQVVLSGIAAACLFSLGNRFERPPAGFFSALFYIIFLDIQRRNLYVLTTSLFLGMTIVSFYLVVRCRNRRQAVPALLAVLFTATIRPEGFFVAVAAGLLVLYRFWTGRRYKLLAASILAGVLLSPLVYVWTVKAASLERPLRYLENGVVIWGHEASRLDSTAAVPERYKRNRQLLSGVLCLAANEPAHFFKLTGTRLAYFLLHTKPYYSPRHNNFIRLVLYPLYLLALVGLAKPGAVAGGRLLFLTHILLYAAMATLMFEDWHGRWLWHALPGVFVLASAGLSRLLSRLEPQPAAG